MAKKTLSEIALGLGKSETASLKAQHAFKSGVSDLWATALATLGTDGKLPLAVFHSPDANDAARKAATNAHRTFYATLKDGIALGMFGEAVAAKLADDTLTGKAVIYNGLDKATCQRRVSAAIGRAKKYVLADFKAAATKGDVTAAQALADYAVATSEGGPWARALKGSKAPEATTETPSMTLEDVRTALTDAKKAVQASEGWPVDVLAVAAMLDTLLATMDKPVSAPAKLPRVRMPRAK
jgi:hypothetical protein